MPTDKGRQPRLSRAVRWPHDSTNDSEANDGDAWIMRIERESLVRLERFWSDQIRYQLSDFKSSPISAQH